jgi:hypothetical protein
MTYSDSGRRDTLHYRLISGSTEDPGLWGNEYVRHLAAELGEEYLAATAADDDEVAKPVEKAEASAEPSTEKESVGAAGPKSGISASAPTWEAVDRPTLLALALEIVPFFLAHNAEADAVDLLLELEAIERIVPLVGKDTFGRVCLYMVSCVRSLPLERLRSHAMLILTPVRQVRFAARAAGRRQVPPDRAGDLRQEQPIFRGDEPRDPARRPRPHPPGVRGAAEYVGLV